MTLMIRDALSVPLRPRAILAQSAQQPAPSYAAMLLNFLVFAALAALIAAISTATRLAPDFAWLLPMAQAWALAHPQASLAIAAGAGLTMILSSFYAAAVLHGLMLLCGAEGGFARSYQTVSLLAPLLLIQALLNGFSGVWILPTLLSAYLAVEAARILHKASPWRAAAAFSLVAALGLAGQWWARAQARQGLEAWNAATTISRLAQSPAGHGEPPEGEAKKELPAPCNPQETQCSAWPYGKGPGPSNAAPSGLDYLLSPPNSAPVASSAIPQPSAPQAASQMMQPVMDMLNDPKLTAGMPPEAAQQMRQLQAMMQKLQGAMADPASLSPQEKAQMARQFQTMAAQMLSQMPKPIGASSPAKDSHAP